MAFAIDRIAIRSACRENILVEQFFVQLVSAERFRRLNCLLIAP